MPKCEIAGTRGCCPWADELVCTIRCARLVPEKTNRHRSEWSRECDIGEEIMNTHGGSPTLPTFIDGYGVPDVTELLETPEQMPHGGPINGQNCAIGACPFVGECGRNHELGMEGVVCIWGAAAMGDEECIAYIMRDHEETVKAKEKFERDTASGGARCFVRGDKDNDPILPTGSEDRKETPIYSGVIRYFPRALAAVARRSFSGNQKHNPGEPLHWAKGKSTDHLDCIARHLVDVGTVDPTDGELHDVMLAWRALANLEIRLEATALGVSYEELIKLYQESQS